MQLAPGISIAKNLALALLLHAAGCLLTSLLQRTWTWHALDKQSVIGPEAILYACLALPLSLGLPFPQLVVLRLFLSAAAYATMLALHQQPCLHCQTAWAGKLEHALRFLVAPAVGLAGDVSRRNIKLLNAAAAHETPGTGPCKTATAAPAPPAKQVASLHTTASPCQPHTKKMAAARPLATTTSTVHADATYCAPAYSKLPSTADFGFCGFESLSDLQSEFSFAPLAGYSSYRRRLRVTVKLPHVDGQALPTFDICATEGHLKQYMGAEVQLQSMSVRAGCVIVELDICQTVSTMHASGSPSHADDNGDSPATPTAAELVEILGLHDVTGASDGQVISVSLDNRITLLRWEQAVHAWVVVPAPMQASTPAGLAPAPGPAATTTQIPPHCMALDRNIVRIALDSFGLAGKGCTYEVVSATGSPLPCTIIATPNNEQGSLVLEVDLAQAGPGLARCNAWSAPTPVSCLVATQPLLLLPKGCGAAATELSRVPIAAGLATANDLFADIGEMLQTIAATSGGSSAATVPSARSQPARGLAYYTGLAEAAQGALAWCRDARCAAAAQLLATQVLLLDGLIAKAVSEAPATPQSSKPGTPTAFAAGATHGGSFSAGPSRLAAAAPASMGAAAGGPRRSSGEAERERTSGLMTNLRATARRIDAALPLRQREMQTSSLPPTLWAIIVCCKCVAASIRSMSSGTGAAELPALILWGLPYVCILLAQGFQRNAGPPSPRPSAARHTNLASRAAALILRYARMLLHIHRSLIVLFMGLGYLRVPYVFSITSAGVDVPAKVMYMAMEAYDYRAAILVILCADIPAFFFLYTRLHVSDALAHVVALGVLGVAMQLAMQSWRRLLESPRPKGAKTI